VSRCWIKKLPWDKKKYAENAKNGYEKSKYREVKVPKDVRIQASEGLLYWVRKIQ
jgi:hypothetical protein